MRARGRIATAITVSLLVGFAGTALTGCIFAAAQGAKKIGEKVSEDEEEEKEKR